MKEHQKEVEAQEGRKYTRGSRKQSQSEQNKSAITDHVNQVKAKTEGLEYGIDVIYLDYKKASDTVRHQRLLKKLQLFGFSGLDG